MKVLFITRSTLLKGFGGDSVQILSTAKYLRKLDVQVDLKLCDEEIDYSPYDIIHLFNIIRPADLLIHISKCNKPYVVSTIFLDYEDYEKKQRKGPLKLLSYFFSKDTIEYIKAIGRFIKNGEKLNSLAYLWLGHKKSIAKIANGASLLLPNSKSEYLRLEQYLGFSTNYQAINNGIDHHRHMSLEGDHEKEEDLVICAARIEGNKNQYNLIKALNNTEFRLKIIGKPAPNHLKYYEACQAIAAPNVSFLGFIELDELAIQYQKANVHVLPSFCETCGLSSLEAAFHKCNLVITKGGDTQDYFEEEAFYCDPEDPQSILDAVRLAAKSAYSKKLNDKVRDSYTWEYAAKQTLHAYNTVLNETKS